MENFPLLGMVAAAVLATCVFGFTGAPLWAWTAATLGMLWWAGIPTWAWIAFGVLAAVFNLPPLRRLLVSSVLLKIMRGVAPKISETERVALRAGDVWVERELFSGKPDFNRLMTEKYPELTAEEKAFLEGPVEELCRMVTDWDIYQRHDLPPEAWEFIKRHGFFGMIIPKKYGGLEFSAFANSQVIVKLASRSVPVAITVMVPNSLGPAELLNHYGTDAQKAHYLPRLARGEEIPCFALTEPHAGSDAASIQASGVVFRGSDGKPQIRLNWNKRYITLASAATLLGLAFKLRDPENILGRGEDLGITCALIPTNAPGVTANRRHDPLGVPFINCPTQGKDVVVPLDAIIGGAEGAGRGWKMLMECLAAGRGISLPAIATTAGLFIARVAGAHATVRRQFGTSIGKFEGIIEPLARVAGHAYLLEAARRYTLGGIDAGRKPPVVTAMAKYFFTEAQRQIVNDGMDIMGGNAIVRGPRNLMAHGYFSVPISITVEGANILTRTLIIFGQGALRAHPYAYKEVEAIETGDLKGFDSAFWSHVGLVVRNLFRSVFLSLSRGWLALPAWVGKDLQTARYYRRLAWSSATFAWMADLAMGTLGPRLKMKGKTTGRFADVLGWMYLATAVLRRYEAEGRRREDLPFVHWSMNYAFNNVQGAFEGLFENFEVPLLGALFRGPIAWYSAMNPVGRKPSDALDHQVAEAIQTPGAQRDRLTSGIFIHPDPTDPLRQLEEAFRLTVETDVIFRKVRKAIHQKKLRKAPPAQLYMEAVAQGVITQDELSMIAQAEQARDIAIQVDDFPAKTSSTASVTSISESDRMRGRAPSA